MRYGLRPIGPSGPIACESGGVAGSGGVPRWWLIITHHLGTRTHKRVHSMSAKNIVFTYNNPSIEAEELIELLQTVCNVDRQGAQTPVFRYCVFQKEEGELGTPHYQGYLQLTHRVRWARINRVLPEGDHMHLEARRGTHQQAVDYCRKEDSRVDGPWEAGTPDATERGDRKDLERYRDAIRSGASVKRLADDHLGCLARYPRLHQALAATSGPTYDPDREHRVSLLIGPPGSGKTRFFYDQHVRREFYRFPVLTGFWADGYDGEPVVLIDDFAGASSKLSLSDRKSVV